MSEKGAKATATLTVNAGVTANEVEIYEYKDGKGGELLKDTKKVDVGGTEKCDGLDVHAKMIPKEEGKTVNYLRCGKGSDSKQRCEDS